MGKSPEHKMAAMGGSDIYSGAATYKLSDQTMKPNTDWLRIRADQAAMITSLKILTNEGEEVDIDALDTNYTYNFIGISLLAGDEISLPFPISEIVIAGGSFIGYRNSR